MPETESGPTPRLIVRDLLVLQADRFGKTANDPTLVQTTLFNGVHRRGRALSDTGGPMPLGLITFEGTIDQPLRVCMDLTAAEARFLAFWPREEMGDRVINWYQVKAATDAQRTVEMPAGHWLAPLRDSEDRLWLSMRNPKLKERFLLYDASLPYQSPYALSASDGRYHVSPADEATPPSLTMLTQRVGGGWVVDAIDASWQNGITPISARPSTTSPAALYARAMTPLRDELGERGYNETEIGLALSMVRSAGLDHSTMSLVYVMPEDAIDQHVWLRFRPEPDRVIRTVIVVVTNVDPDLGSRVQTLIANLGSDDWAERDQAQQMLTQMGQAAIPQVQEQRDHADPEVAFRARQILDAYDLRTQGTR